MNNETFDALLFNKANELMFQITVEENHDIKSHGLLDLYKDLPTVGPRGRGGGMCGGESFVFFCLFC